MTPPSAPIFPVASDSILFIEDQVNFQAILDEPTETDSLLGISKRKFPRRVIMLLTVCVTFALTCTTVLSASIDLQYQYICRHFSISPDQCMSSKLVNKRIADLMGVNSMLISGLSLISGSLISMVSDKLGRKPMMIYSMVLSMMSFISQYFIYFKLNSSFSVYILCIPKVIDGLGGNPTFIAMLCIPYVSDTIRDSGIRTKLIASVNGCLYASVAVGPTVGSYIVRNYGFKSLYYFIITGIVVCIIIMAVFLRESLSTFHRRKNSNSNETMASRMTILKFPFIKDKVSRRNIYIVFIASLFGQDFTIAMAPLLLLFSKFKFGWTAVQQGYLLSGMSGTRTTWLLIGFPFLYSVLSSFWRVHPDKIDRLDLIFVRLALFFPLVAFLLMGHSTSGNQFVWACLLDACSAAGSSVFTSSLIKYIPSDKFGTFMAASNFMASMTGLFLAPTILKVFSLAIGWRPSLPFEIAAFMISLMLCLTLFVQPAGHKD